MDLSTTYNGIKIKNPIIIGSCGLTNSVEKNVELAKNNVGAIVLKSIFEEQIISEADKDSSINEYDYPEAHDYIRSHIKKDYLTKYLKLVEETKKAVDIPVIASINCVSAKTWTSFAKNIENAGVDAIELNISNLPTNIDRKSSDYEKVYFDIIEKVSSEVKIPLSIKMNTFSAGLSNLIRTLDWTKKVKSFVMFNRYYSPDFDIEKLMINSSNVFSSTEEYTTPLRWVAIMSENIRAEIIASTGIHTGEAVIKQILAGANATQLVSVFYKNGNNEINKILQEIEQWMKRKKFNTIEEFKGKMNYKSVSDPSALERIQFMKYYSGIE